MTVGPLTNFSPTQSGQYLFQREYSLAIAPPKQSASIQYSSMATIGSDGTLLPPSPLRISFDIQKTPTGTSSKAKIVLYNISAQTRKQVLAGWNVLLKAGYKGNVLPLFLGAVHPNGLKSARSGSEITLEMECGDGEAAIVMSTLDKSYPNNTTLSQILGDIATAMNDSTTLVPQGVTSSSAINVPNVQYARGITVSGPCQQTLTNLLEPLGMRWSVQNGVLTILPVTAYNQNPAILVSKETGLIGVPSLNKTFVEFTSLLNPNIQPNSLVQIKSEDTSFNGSFKVLNAHYEGDTYDNKWQVKCQCVKLDNVVQDLPASSGFDFSSGVAIG